MTRIAVIPHKAEAQLIRYEAACLALAEAKAVDEVLEIRNRSEAMAVYAKQSKNKRLEVDAAEIRIRATRRLGELILQQKAETGLNKGVRMAGKKDGSSVVVADDRRQVPTLADAGISKDLSSQAQKFAAVPKDEFEAELGDWRDRIAVDNQRVTTRLVAAGEKASRPAKPDKNAPTIESLSAQLADMKEELHEARHVAQELAHDLESYASATAGEVEAAKELSRLKALLRTVEGTRDQWMTTCSELRKEVKGLQRKLKVAQ